MGLTKKFISALSGVLAKCPLTDPTFFNGFSYTRTGNNLCHPRALGLIAKAGWSLSEAAAVEIDVRLNLGGVKFQPDVAIRNRNKDLALAIDFESPNSSDARVPRKDVDAYLAWAEAGGGCEYVIITTLPDRPAMDWELRYASPGYLNNGHDRAKIRKNPFRYWYRYYKSQLDPRWRDYPIRFANLNGKKLRIVDRNILS